MTERLGAKAVTAIEEAAKSMTLAVSAISVWELAMLVRSEGASRSPRP